MHHLCLRKLVFTKMAYDFFCYIQKKREVIFHIYDAIRITLAMMTLEYLGRLIVSRPGHKTVRAFISMKTLRATNTL